MIHKENLQPWLDYFDMLDVYEQKGYLEVSPEKHEAFVTQPALYALSEDMTAKAVSDVLYRIRAYAGFKSHEGPGYLDRFFAVHVVKDSLPHDVLHTLLLARRRVWWKLWVQADYVEVINYQKE